VAIHNHSFDPPYITARPKPKRRRKDNRPFWTGDCESDPFKHNRVPKPFIWGLWTGASFHTFDTPEEFVEFIKDCDVIIYFHNGGKFDIHFLLKHINLFEEVKVINGRLVVAHIGKAELRDSWNLLPIALADYKKDDLDELADKLEALGENRKIAADYQLMEERHRKRPGVAKVIREYLRNDCIYLHYLIEQFERDYGRHLTQAGASMAEWKKTSGLKSPVTDAEFFHRFKKYYYGGRVQCFQKGKIEGPAEVIDIKSAYPDAMMSDHPYFPEYTETDNPDSYNNTSMLTVECRSNSALPFRTERGEIIFPDDGELRTFYVPGHELRAGEETGTVRDVRLIHSIDFIGLVSFREYISRFYDLRKIAKKQGEKAVDIFCKLFMNSLYGKFGANPENYGNFECVPFDEFEGHICRCKNPTACDEWHFDGMIGPHALIRRNLDDWQAKYLNVATAASITSQVRAKLWRAICACDSPYYCDTDSLICRNFSVEIGPELGQWEHEGTAHTLYIAGKKMYLCDGLLKLNTRNGKMEPKMASKGARLTPAQIKRMCKGHSVLYQPKAPTFSLHKKPAFVDRVLRMT